MSKRSSLPAARQLDVMRLLADVAALKGDLPAQRQHLIDGLNFLLRTQAAWFYVIDDFVPGRRPVVRDYVLARDPDPEFVRAQQWVAAADVPMEAEPFADHALHDGSPLQLWTRAQVHSRPDAATRYAPTLALYDAARVVDGAVALYRDVPDAARVVGVAVHRMHGGEGKLRGRDHALLQFAVRELQDLARRGHFSLGDRAAGADSLPPLPPRLRQTLNGLLRGKGVKQIARELDLSVWTVREHIQRLYRHFGVNGRDELMASFMGR